MAAAFDNQSKLRILALLGLIGASAVAGFGVYRALMGQWGMAAIDLCIVVALLAPVLYAWRTGDTLRAGMFLCLFETVACALVAWVMGPAGLHWLALVLMSNFFIATPRMAALCNFGLIVAVLLMPHLYGSTVEIVTVGATAALVTLFAYLFATQVRDERENLEAMATVDVLTGVPNRRSMERALEGALRRRDECGARFGLLMLDLDNFKEVNDTFGHTAGDAALADLAAILKFEMRHNDAVFRFGGEEFVVLAEVDGRQALMAIAERVRLAVRKSLRGPAGRITVSLGAAMLEDEVNWQEWFSLADTALYQAKNNGRDNSVVYAPGE